MSNDHLVKSLEKKLAAWKPKAVEETYGEVLEVGDGIAKISGLSTVMSSEMIEITTQDGSKIAG
ncbi:MAG: F-type H+/Na+-transporting ATPase subunit alpha, partial [Patescibacteria group bacterium]|nr:F-type H+/Na+-transporting ATPase subunit alpha [Patescibacteria group bacterium]